VSTWNPDAKAEPIYAQVIGTWRRTHGGADPGDVKAPKAPARPTRTRKPRKAVAR
jgi:hypothetical protein